MVVFNYYICYYDIFCNAENLEVRIVFTKAFSTWLYFYTRTGTLPSDVLFGLFFVYLTYVLGISNWLRLKTLHF